MDQCVKHFPELKSQKRKAAAGLDTRHDKKKLVKNQEKNTIFRHTFKTSTN